MKDFIEKWNTDSRFKTKVKLGMYTLFVVIVAIFALSNRGTIATEPLIDNGDDVENKTIIEIPNKYHYVINIEINENKYKYIGSREQEQETIQKISNNITHNYIFKDNKYFRDIVTISNIIDKEEVYDIINYSYLDINNINKYLSISQKENKKNLVYIKDIILGHDSEEYITIKIDKNKINIDYTSLMKLFDSSLETCTVEIIIEEIE